MRLLRRLTGSWRLREELAALHNVFMGASSAAQAFGTAVVSRLVRRDTYHESSALIQDTE